MAKQKKPVINGGNPADGFLSIRSQKEKAPAPEHGAEVTIPEGFRLVPITETKSRRLQLIMKPSLHEKVKRAAHEEYLSFNDYVHRLLEKAMKERE